MLILIWAALQPLLCVNESLEQLMRGLLTAGSSQSADGHHEMRRCESDSHVLPTSHFILVISESCVGVDLWQLCMVVQ